MIADKRHHQMDDETAVALLAVSLCGNATLLILPWNWMRNWTSGEFADVPLAVWLCVAFAAILLNWVFYRHALSLHVLSSAARWKINLPIAAVSLLFGYWLWRAPFMRIFFDESFPPRFDPVRGTSLIVYGIFSVHCLLLACSSLVIRALIRYRSH